MKNKIKIKHFKYLFAVLNGFILILLIKYKKYELSKNCEHNFLNRYKFCSKKINTLVNKIKKPSLYIRNLFKQYLLQLPNYTHTHEYSNIIFWCWLQGEIYAPKLTLSCLNSFKKNCKNHEIIIITAKNMLQYIHFPNYILQKYKKKIISKPHFADLLRLELLIKYGGSWADASLLLTKYDSNFFNKDLFFFQIFNKYWIAGSNWFITSEKKSPILKTTRDLLYEYWRKNNHAFNYFIFHMYFKMACDRYIYDYHKIKKYSNQSPHILQSVLFQPFRLKVYNQIILNVSIHKLTTKKKPKKKSGLIYHHIIKQYL